jgi:hypothetical protein
VCSSGTIAFSLPHMLSLVALNLIQHTDTPFPCLIWFGHLLFLPGPPGKVPAFPLLGCRNKRKAREAPSFEESIPRQKESCAETKIGLTVARENGWSPGVAHADDSGAKPIRGGNFPAVLIVDTDVHHAFCTIFSNFCARNLSHGVSGSCLLDVGHSAS